MCRYLRKKNKGNPDIRLLLSLLVIFSFFVGCLHGVSFHKKNQLHGNIRSMSMNAMLSYVHPLIISGSVEKIADFSKHLSPDSAYQLAKTIVTQWNSTLSRDDLLELLFAFSTSHAGKKKQQNSLFGLIPEYQSLFEDGAPLAYVAALSGYAHIIPALETWAKEYVRTNKNVPDFIKDDTRKAAQYAISKNKRSDLKNILEYSGSVRHEEYTNLLWSTIENNRDARIIPLLVHKGANPRSSRGSYTVLMQAVQKNNVPAVKELIKVGADVNTILDNETGSALQLALINNFVKMEQVLRSHGANK